MSLGSRIRNALGPLERPASERYRSLFLDLDALVDRIAAWTPATNILEIGCGDGMVTARLADRYPRARVTGIDIGAEPGRQFQGDHSRVEFHQQQVEEFAAGHTGTFDLVLLCDVLHHVPPDERGGVLTGARRALAPGGRVVLKEWERADTLITGLTWLLEVGVGGAFTRYETGEHWRSLLGTHFGAEQDIQEERIAPWHNNVLFMTPVIRTSEEHDPQRGSAR